MNPLQENLRTIRVLYSTILGGSLFFILISLFIVASIGPLAPIDKPTLTILLAVANVVGLSGVYGGIMVFRSRLKDIRNADNLKKLDLYKSAMIIRAALLESTTFFFVVIYLLSGHYLAIAESTLFIALMGFYFPTVLRVSQEIDIDPRDLL